MSKEATKNMQIIINEECWRELNILRYRKNKKNVQEVIRDILENYTNKFKDKNIETLSS